VTIRELGRRRRELERELVHIGRELLPLCPMKASAVALQDRRAEVLRELAEVRTRIAEARGECPRPRRAAWDRR
jgi:hypothetical protein